MEKIEQTLIVSNKKGLHARPAALLVQLVSKYQSQVTINYDGQQVNGKSIMGILTLGAPCGAKLTFIVHGPDAKEVFEAISVFLSKQEEEFLT